MENNLNTSQSPTETQPIPPKKLSFFWDLIIFTTVALAIILPIRAYVAQPFIVSGSSMFPTFVDKQYLIVDELSYHFRPISRGDVVVFHPPVSTGDADKYFIKRIIGLPGETLEIHGSAVTIFNPAHPNGVILNETYLDSSEAASNTLHITLHKDQYFVMGDNRAASFDSRSWGPADRSGIIGRPVVRLYPFNDMAVYPGQVVSQD